MVHNVPCPRPITPFPPAMTLTNARSSRFIIATLTIPSRICDGECCTITSNLKIRLLPCKVSHTPSPYSSDPPPSYMPPPSTCPTPYSADPSAQSPPQARQGQRGCAASAH